LTPQTLAKLSKADARQLSVVARRSFAAAVSSGQVILSQAKLRAHSALKKNIIYRLPILELYVRE